MKLTLLLLFVTVLTSIAADSYSQSTKLTLKLENVRIEDLLNKIEDQSQFRFFYNEEINLDKKVSIDVSTETILNILDKIFADKGIHYEIVGRQIILSNINNSNNISSQQQKTVSGKVTDSSGGPLPGVSVVVKGTTTGTIADSNGNYSLANVPANATLLFSFVGMKTQEVITTSKTSVNIMLVEETVGLDEVVAIGYGTVKKSDLTGSVASVKSEELSSIPTTTLAQTMQGRAPGVLVQQNSGAPGATIQVRIRGVNSIRGNNEPLWVIDGFPGDPNMLNNGDVESMEILKDASATAIYGSRGANGVILVTTKHGKKGITKVDYDGSYSVQSVRKKLDLLNVSEYMQLMNVQQNNDLGKDYFTQNDISNAGKGVDWQDLLYRSAPVQDHTLTVSGGNEKTQFSMSAGSFDQEGIIIGSNYSRISIRANINHDISKKFSVFYNAILSRSDSRNPYASGGFRGTSLISAIAGAPTTLSPYNDDGSYRLLKTAYPFMSDGLINPVAYVNEIENKWLSNRIMASLGFTFKPLDGLSVKVSGNVANNDSRSDNYTSLKYPGSIGNASISTSNGLTLSGEGLINYNKTINKDHSILFTAGTTYEQYTATAVGVSGSGFLSDASETYNIGSASTIGTPSSSYSKWQLLSYLGRINYTFKGKYMATMSMRADGSSRYSQDNKWGYFPSGALAYRVSEENFMKTIDFISDLKLRVGYGETGSTAIDPYYTLDMLSSGKATFNDALYTYYAPGTRLPGNLKWETTAQTDIGMDISFFNQKIRLTADYYIKNTRDLLNPVQLPRSLGYTATIKNVGEMQNRGPEFQLDANILGGDFKWDVSGNISFNKNKVIKLYDGQDMFGDALNITIIQDYINLIREGQPMGVFYGYRENGYDSNGKIAYKDLNNDGAITAADKTYIGNPNPDFIFGLNSTMSWKNFEFKFFIQGVEGNDIYSLSLAAQTLDYGMGLNTLKEVLYDRWTPETPNAKYPKVSKSSTIRASDRFVYDGSYVRLKDIQLAYNIPVERLGIQWLKKGQVYFSGQNLLTITSYPWQDPEINSFGGGTSVTQGIDQYSYPVSKGFTFGMKLTF